MADQRATGTELAAMRLALGVLRRSALRRTVAGGIFAASTALDLGGVYCVARAIPRIESALGFRLLRARLALYLRARLRMERGEQPARERRVCHRCGSWDIRSTLIGSGRGARLADLCHRCGGHVLVWRRVGPPLWELTPAHEVRR